jgi:hypothetical protein
MVQSSSSDFSEADLDNPNDGEQRPSKEAL